MGQHCEVVEVMVVQCDHSSERCLFRPRVADFPGKEAPKKLEDPELFGVLFICRSLSNADGCFYFSPFGRLK